MCVRVWRVLTLHFGSIAITSDWLPSLLQSVEPASPLSDVIFNFGLFISTESEVIFAVFLQNFCKALENKALWLYTKIPRNFSDDAGSGKFTMSHDQAKKTNLTPSGL